MSELLVDYYNEHVELPNEKRRFVMTKNPSTSKTLCRLEVVLPGETDPVCVYSCDIETIVPDFPNGWHHPNDLEPIVKKLNDALEAGWSPNFLK